MALRSEHAVKPVGESKQLDQTKVLVKHAEFYQLNEVKALAPKVLGKQTKQKQTNANKTSKHKQNN